jgi:cis-3-alkyl-4-acyloxetan-2-one decarboxylase
MKNRLDLIWHNYLKRPYRLHVEHAGTPGKPVIVFIHGIAASTEDWSKFIPLFEKDYRCILIDLLGFGKSPKPQWADYTMETHTRSLFHTMNKQHIGKKFTLVGHSLGSFLAARYALEHGERLEKLVLLSPPVYPPLENIKAPYARRLTGTLLASYKLLRSERMTPNTFRLLSKVAPLPRNVTRHPETWTPFMRTLQNCIEQQTILYDVKHSRVPTDVFYGSLDQVVVSGNVKLLAEQKRVLLHPFIGNHDLTVRYARLVRARLTRN